MDKEFSQHERLLQQLKQLKRELAKKERKLMDMEKIAQARKRHSSEMSRGSPRPVGDNRNQCEKPNASSTGKSASFSTKDDSLGNGVLKKTRKSDDQSCSNTHWKSSCSPIEKLHQENTAMALSQDSLSKNSLTLPYECTPQNEKKCISSSTPVKANEIFPFIDETNATETEVFAISTPSNPFNEVTGSVTVKNDVKSAAKSDTLQNENSMENRYCDTKSIGHSVSKSLGCESSNFTVSSPEGKGSSSLLLKPSITGSCISIHEKCKNTSVVSAYDKHSGIFKKEKQCLEPEFPMEFKQKKSSSSLHNSDTMNQKGFITAHSTSMVQFPKTHCVKQNMSEPVITSKPSVSCIGTDCSKGLNKMSVFPSTIQKQKNLKNSPDCDITVFAEKTKYITDSSLSEESISNKVEEWFKRNSNEETRATEQQAADVSYSEKLYQPFLSDRVSNSTPSSCRRSQRIAKQKTEKKSEQCVNDKQSSFITHCFKWLLQNYNSSDNVDFELPVEDFGLLMEIKVKNSAGAWSLSPSETFGIISSENFIPDSQEDKNPYSHCHKSLYSSLSGKFPSTSVEEPHETLECFSKSLERKLVKNSSEVSRSQASHTSTYDIEVHMQPEDEATIDQSSFQELPEESDVVDHIKSHWKSKAKSQIIFESEMLNPSDVNTEMPVEKKTLCINSHASEDFVNNELLSATDVKTCDLWNQTTTTQECENSISEQQFDLFSNTWTLSKPSAFCFDLENKISAENTDLDITGLTMDDDEDKLFTTDNLCIDPSSCNKATETSVVEPLIELKNNDFQPKSFSLLENILPGEGKSSISTDSACDKQRNLSFLCCLETENKEPVKRIHTTAMGGVVLIVMQCDSVIEIWEKITEEKWTKIGSYKTGNMACIQKSYLLKEEKCIVLLLLLHANGRQNLRFLTVDDSLQIIQVKEHDYPGLSRCNEKSRLMLCGLENLIFASAEGSECFSIGVHSVEASGSQKSFLTTRKLGDVSDCLLGISNVQNAPKALLGWSTECMYVWNYVSGELVTVAKLVPKPSVSYDKCLWATSEEGLLFLLMTSSNEDFLASCHLLAVNPVTGLWDAIQYFQHSSHGKNVVENKCIDGIVQGRHVVVSCCKNSYLWDLYTGDNIASLMGCEVSAVMYSDKILAIGLQSGCTNLYNFQ